MTRPSTEGFCDRFRGTEGEGQSVNRSEQSYALLAGQQRSPGPDTEARQNSSVRWTQPDLAHEDNTRRPSHYAAEENMHTS